MKPPPTKLATTDLARCYKSKARVLAICSISVKATEAWSIDDSERVKRHVQQSQRQLRDDSCDIQHFWVSGFGRLQDALHNGFLWLTPAPALPSQVEEAVEMLRASRIASLEIELNLLRADNDIPLSELDSFSELATLTLALVEVPINVASVTDSTSRVLRRHLAGKLGSARQLTNSC